jgi:hypothetical protein
MGIETGVHHILDTMVVVGKTLHFPFMVGAFILGATFRVLIYFTVRRHEWFGREFENRVSQFLASEMDHKHENVSFYVVTKRLMERTFYELFEKRDQARRSKPDNMILLSDRLFLIKMGCAWLVHDILKQIRFLKYGMQPPKLINITKNTFSKNPAFNRVFGLIPSIGLNDLLNILPGLFVIGGIFGTFLGVMKGLPELGGMDMGDPVKTKAIMDRFLVEISLSMGASITGIFLSVCMTLINTAFSPERRFVDIVDRFENSLDLLWNYSHSNEVPVGLKQFNENDDPVEALASAALNQELDKTRGRAATLSTSSATTEDKPTAKSA